MENSGLVIQLLTEIKSEIAGASGFKFSNIIVALIVAFSYFTWHSYSGIDSKCN